MVVTDGIFQEVFAGEGGFVELKLDLGAAEIAFREIPQDASFGDEGLRKVSGDLEDGHVLLGEMAPDADPDARFEMGVQGNIVDDVERNGAVGEYDPACFGIDA